LINYQFLESDVQWSTKTCIAFGALGLLAGVCAGTLGISSGMILGPLFLKMNLLPDVITSTTAFMIVFAQTSVSLQFVIADAISWQLSLFFMATGACASILGQIVLLIKNRISKRDSVLALMMACVVVLSCIALLGVGIYDQIVYKAPLGFRNFCNVVK